MPLVSFSMSSLEESREEKSFSMIKIISFLKTD